eukprot:TRINITY_DN19300_c0_g1_i1.p1 TRINITY_DN19300_c0_g1~~TRINITY_DN19300_c0_g1_i1.p1  ORF type:complete len:271 (+),score=43.07 TRINITY_DN19300_c0_g1_i1:104-916(+)
MEAWVGRGLLASGLAACAATALVGWRLYEKRPGLDTAAYVCLALSHTYAALTLVVGALLPLRMVYDRPDLIEMMHRTRYLILDCLGLPCVFWLLLLWALPPALAEWLPSEGLVRSALLAALLSASMALAAPAARDCTTYPFSPDNCLGVLYYRPARFTQKMRYPCLYVQRALYGFAMCRLLAARSGWLLLGTGVFRLAFHGHTSGWRYWPWEIFAQPLAMSLLSLALLWSADVNVVCTGGLMQCVVTYPGGAASLVLVGTSGAGIGRLGL